MSSNANSRRAGYCNPPEDTKFKAGHAALPRQAKKPDPNETIITAILKKAKEPIRNPQGGRRTNRLREGARALVIRASQGDRRALREIVGFRKEANRHKPVVRKIPYLQAASKKGADLTNAFFDSQDRKKEELCRAAKAHDGFPEQIDRELRRRIRVPRGGRSVRMSMESIIIHNFANELATGDAALVRLIDKLGPPKRFSSPPIFDEVKRPTAEELAHIDEEKRQRREQIREGMREDFPNIDWDDDDVARDFIKRKFPWITWD